MSALGQKQTCALHLVMSAPPKADIQRANSRDKQKSVRIDQGNVTVAPRWPNYGWAGSNSKISSTRKPWDGQVNRT